MEERRGKKGFVKQQTAYWVKECDWIFFFFKQKTAYEIKECDWSSDVCSSDLFWLYYTTGGSHYAIVAQATSGGSSFIYRKNTANKMSIFSNTAESTTAVSTSTWKWLCWVYDDIAGSSTFYINGNNDTADHGGAISGWGDGSSNVIGAYDKGTGLYNLNGKKIGRAHV